LSKGTGVPGLGRGILFSRWERRKGGGSLGAAFCFEVGVEEDRMGSNGIVRRLDWGIYKRSDCTTTVYFISQVLLWKGRDI
jgi:hypothetical protein